MNGTTPSPDQPAQPSPAPPEVPPTAMPVQPSAYDPTLHGWVPPPTPPPTVPPGTNGFAIAALVISFCSPLFGFVFAVVALIQTRQTGQKGKGLALGALGVCAAWVVTFATIGVVLAITDDGNDAPARTPAAAVSAAGDVENVPVSLLAVGDCLQEFDDDDYRIPVVPCGDEHTAEVYAAFDAEGDAGTYPGEEEIWDQAEDGCSAALETYGPGSGTDYLYYYPLADGWYDGDHEILCIAYHDEPRTGSIKD